MPIYFHVVKDVTTVGVIMCMRVVIYVWLHFGIPALLFVLSVLVCHCAGRMLGSSFYLTFWEGPMFALDCNIIIGVLIKLRSARGCILDWSLVPGCAAL